MRLRKKVLLAALAVTLTSTNLFAKDISFAAEESSTEPLQVESGEVDTKISQEVVSEDSTTEKNLQLTSQLDNEYTIDQIKGMVEVLKDDLKILLYNSEFENSSDNNSTEVLDNLSIYKDAYKSLLDLEEDKNKEDSVKYQDSLISVYSIKDKLQSDKMKLENALDENLENNDLEKKALIDIKENLISILGTLENVKVKSVDDTKVLDSINEGEQYKQYLKEKNVLKEEVNSLASKIEDNEDRIGYLQEDDKKQVKSDLETVKNLLAEGNPTLEELQNSKDKLILISENLDKISNPIDSKEILSKKIDELKVKINDNTKYLSKKFYDQSILDIDNIDKEIANADQDKLNQYLKDLTVTDQNIDRIIEKVSALDLSKIRKEIEKANSNKETQAYYRASADKRETYVKAISQAETYLQSILEKVNDNPESFNSQTYKDQETNKYIKKLTEAYYNLDGLTYDKLLENAEEKFEENKNSLSEDSITELQKQLDLLSISKNKANTVDDIDYFSELIDEKVKKDKLISSKKSQVNVKKVAVPKAANKAKTKAKSIVRTGIDSIKIIGVVAIVALVLLLVTRKKKDN